MPCICVSKSNRSVRSKANGSASKWGVWQQDIVGGNARTKFSHHTCGSFDIALERRECKLGLLPSLADCAAPTSRERNATACPFAEGRGRGGRHFKVIAYACLQNTQPRWQLHGARSLLSNTCISRCRAPPLSPLSKVELDIGIA